MLNQTVIEIELTLDHSYSSLIVRILHTFDLIFSATHFYIRKKIYSFIEFLFSLQCILANSLDYKLNLAKGQNFIKQWVWDRISVVPYVFMISLTFVRQSNGSFITVGMTTGFRSACYGLESRNLFLHFYLNIMLLIYEDCFFYSYQNYRSLWFSAGAHEMKSWLL